MWKHFYCLMKKAVLKLFFFLNMRHFHEGPLWGGQCCPSTRPAQGSGRFPKVKLSERGISPQQKWSQEVLGKA